MADNEPQDAGNLEDGGTPDVSGGSATNMLKSKQVVIPLAAGLATAAAVLGAKKGAGAVSGAASKIQEKGQETVNETAENAGKSSVEGAKDALGAGKLGAVGKLASKLTGGGGGGNKGDKKTRRLPIQRWTDVAVPVEEAYEKWVDFEEYPKFMHRVLSVSHEEPEGDEPEKVKWEEKIWFSKRQWEAEVTEREENDRIAWRTLNGTNHSGVVSFHRLDDNLTRVLVTVDFRPTGLIEKMGSGLRFAKRAVQADLARFKAYVELGREATGEEPEAREQREQQEQEEQGQDGDQPQASSDGGDQSDEGDEANEDVDQEPRAASQGDDGEDEDAEEARREREQRRAERRERVSAS